MYISFFDIFKIGIGPSSSHTIGPMKAAFEFISKAIDEKKIDLIKTIKCDLYGSLALTGRGHGTDKAVQLGLSGLKPETIDSDKIVGILEDIKKSEKIIFLIKGKKHQILFNAQTNIKFNRKVFLPHHPNGMAFTGLSGDGDEVFREVYYSVGGGFVLTEKELLVDKETKKEVCKVKYDFGTAVELLAICEKEELSIPQVIFQNELNWRTAKEINQEILYFWKVMDNCIEKGLKNEGVLPGGLKVKRRASSVHKNLLENLEKNLSDNLFVLDWVNLYALAVNEENAGGGQVVTAPTNGAAGIIPAVLKYYINFYPKATEAGVVDFLLTASAIAMLYKKNASISGAEVGCQGEVGVACSMAAGALTQVMGGSPLQVENAAEIAMEHNLGLTCDPIGGLVQIPCIERNAMGAIKAINASRMALQGDGYHFVSLDKVIKTMKQTGLDMKRQYKETSRGGLAVNIPEC